MNEPSVGSIGDARDGSEGLTRFPHDQTAGDVQVLARNRNSSLTSTIHGTLYCSLRPTRLQRDTIATDVVVSGIGGT